MILAIAAKVAVAGIGPFEATVASAAGEGGALVVTLTVTNHGASTGQSTCQVIDLADRTGNPGAFILTPKIDPGQTVTFSRQVTVLGSAVLPPAVDGPAPRRTYHHPLTAPRP